MLRRRWHALALALGAALAVAFTAITVGHGSSNAAVLPRFPYASTAVSSLLERLPAPAGFHRAGCVVPARNVDTACFRSARTAPASTALMGAIARRFGVTLDVPGRECRHRHAYTVPGDPAVELPACDERATLDGQHLLILVTSSRGGRVPRGTQVTVTDYGA